jgi:hypothetical protein
LVEFIPLEDFDTAAAKTQGAADMELMAQVRLSIYIYIPPLRVHNNGKLNSSLTPAFICGIAAWALSAKNFKPPTVRSYLFILATVHKLKVFSAHSCSNSLGKCVLKGAGKLAFYTTISNESKK